MLKKNELFVNKTKALLKDEKKTVGSWLQLASPLSAEIIAKAGFDWALIDMEHAPGDIMTLIGQCQALNAYDVEPFVRTPWNDKVIIKKILDAGVYGILVPYVNTAEEARAVVAAAKYPPEGVRGIAPSPRAGGFGMNDLNYLQHANEQMLIIVAIETPEAVENVEEILAVEGLDGVFVGPMDLATSMGHFCNPAAEEVQDAIAKVESATSKSDKFIGTVAGSIEQAVSLYEKGYTFVVAMSDSVSLGKLAMQNVATFNSNFPDR
ncbi:MULTISPECIES: HpcH/HpaI aldolase/citrate lyase family protein [unclassified Sporosarcina]|uniref:HpcH/HpaI aldolase family protein n=1 Tax=unclassified Sporosarcina TaxID=2647733 RepID=UPI00203EBB86|nr:MULTISPECIES: aldolase/citrate lyase family protein [unclassified Sporosarcina]GKV66939.1 2,4-dihydroxyhept-2-ene-1,7-dioic acid aldolase [Sporosarcina sp. NCCP-2331]GLB57304.1 2,4-dihydroxyhept-2-ene-1,7-dioic acid aldolase [Sporosarcina sp. NCCP-2378]